MCIVFNKLELKPEQEEQWGWMDPGLFALLGSASFMAGTSRLPVTSVVMLVCVNNISKN